MRQTFQLRNREAPRDDCWRWSRWSVLFIVIAAAPLDANDEIGVTVPEQSLPAPAIVDEPAIAESTPSDGDCVAEDLSPPVYGIWPYLRPLHLAWWPSIRDEKTAHVVENLDRQAMAVEARQQRFAEASYWDRKAYRHSGVQPAGYFEDDGAITNDSEDVAVVPRSRYLIERTWRPPDDYAPDLFGITVGAGYSLNLYNRAVQTVPIVADHRAPVTQNMAAVPSNRVFLTQAIYPDAYPRKVSFQQYTFGMERTLEMFGEQMGLLSFEARIPISVQPPLNITTSSASPPPNNVVAEFGNVCFVVKGLLCGNCHYSLTAGLGIDVPTQPDVNAAITGGPRFRVANNIVGLAPYLSGQYQPTRRLSATGVSVLHVAAGSDRVVYNRGATGSFAAFDRREEFSQATAVQLSGSLAYLLCECKNQDGFAWFFPILELDYVGSLQDARPIIFHDPFLAAASGSDIAAVAPLNQRTNFLAAQLGTKFRFCRYIDIGVAGIVPIGNQGQGAGSFDWGLQVQSSIRFCAD